MREAIVIAVFVPDEQNDADTAEYQTGEKHMATRPVFIVKPRAPYYDVVNVVFEWSGGFAKVQKQKNITAIHDGFRQRMPGKEVLEISSKSMQPGGETLSAFFLPKYVPELGKSVPLECVFRAGKVFRNGEPFKDLMMCLPEMQNEMSACAAADC